MDSSANDERVIITNAALESYQKYRSANNHKAFAQSESGAWNWRADRTNQEYAMKNALMGCRANNKVENEYPCKIININGEWVGSQVENQR
jgi:hypothetical protein